MASGAAGQALRLEDAVRRTVRRNPELAAARAQVLSSSYRHKSDYAAFLPSLSGDAQLSQGGDGGLGARASVPRYGVSLSARQSLFSGFRDKAVFEQSEAQFAIALADLDSVKARISFELKRAFANVSYIQRQVEVSQDILDRRRENVRLVGLRYEGGRENKGSLLRSQAALRQAEFELANARRDMIVARSELGRVMGELEPDFESVERLLGADYPSVEPPFASLLTQTPQYWQAELRLAAAKAGLTIARSVFYPSFSASASVSRRGDDLSLDEDSWSTGLSLSFPVFSGGQNMFGVKAAHADLDQQAATLDTVRMRIGSELRDAFYAFQRAAEAIEVRRQFLDAAEVRAQIARSQYANGLLSFEDWDTIENDLIRSENDMLAALVNAAVAEANWERAQGKGVLP